VTGNLESRLQLVRDTRLFPPMLVERLRRFIETAEERELYRVNPLAWAASQQADENLVIDLFLHAAAAGLFELIWNMLCTQCGMVITTPGGLRAFSKTQRHCRL